MDRTSVASHAQSVQGAPKLGSSGDCFLLICRVVGSKQAFPAKRQVFRELVVSLDLGRTLVYGATHGIIHDPFQQELRAHRFPQLLQGQREAIARAVAVDAGEHGGGCERAALYSQRELHEERVVFADQRPVHGAAEQRIDAWVMAIAVWPIQFQFPPAAYTRHEFDPEQIRKTEDGRRLTVGICAHAFGLQVRQVPEQGIEDVGGFIGAAGDESAEQGNIVVGNVAIGDSAGLSKADMVLSQQIVLVGFEVRPVRCRRLAGAPLPR